MLKFSPANAKTKNLRSVPALAVYLGKVGRKTRKVYSLDLSSGWSCPFAKDCFSKVVETADGRKIKDGPDCEFRCFSASQEALFPAVYDARKHNFDLLRACESTESMADIIDESLPDDAGIVRIHVGGDFFSPNYFVAWCMVAKLNPNTLFYAYTKSLSYWIRFADTVPNNLVLTASYGGRQDDLIEKHGLRYAAVIAEKDACAAIHKYGLEYWTGGLAIDHDDSHAARPDLRNESFYLLVHGTQPAGSDAGKAVSALNGKGSYNRK